MEIYLLFVVAVLLFINQIKLRRRQDTQLLALRGVKGHISSVNKQYEECIGKLNGLYNVVTGIEGNVTSLMHAPNRDQINSLLQNINGVAEYNIELSNKISALEKRLPKKKVAKKKVTKKVTRRK